MLFIRRFRSLPTLVLILTAAALHAQEPAPPPEVRAQQAASRVLHPAFEYPGSLESLETASIRPQISARIIERNVTPGETVRKGDVLFVLDDRDYAIAVMSAEASVRLAQATLGQAQAEFERSSALADRGTASQQQLDLATATRDAAQAQQAIAEASLAKARKDLDDTKVLAPFDGRISAASNASGDYVTPTNELAQIVRLDPIYSLSYISQQAYNTFMRAQQQVEQATGQVAGMDLKIELADHELYPHEGKFIGWDFQAAATTGSIAARVEFPNPDGFLLPGENVTVHGRSRLGVDAVLVPQRAVSQDQQGHFLMLVAEDGTVERRNVEMGIRDGTDWVVREGLEVGETFIVDGLQKARPGQKVTIAPAEQ
ncbi:efflux RND transporter periplasmic adaptor subunit [Paracoccus ravus]|uniref:efflux RND transporter periplasmic adaptor subunit n=1 Tax=Paracoccus ravus TaxID=2447760 RepID=UPI00106E266F|nr:efflux RND transporter periplasmic adaptor subunit [Paracoccus ravus]